MVTIETIKQLLFGDGNGLITQMRDGNYEALTPDLTGAVLQYAKSFNEEVRSGKFNSEGMAVLVILLSYIHNMDRNPVYEKFFEQYDRFYNDLSYEMTKGI
jgi:hypothetical protein